MKTMITQKPQTTRKIYAIPAIISHDCVKEICWIMWQNELTYKTFYKYKNIKFKDNERARLRDE